MTMTRALRGWLAAAVVVLVASFPIATGAPPAGVGSAEHGPGRGFDFGALAQSVRLAFRAGDEGGFTERVGATRRGSTGAVR